MTADPRRHFVLGPCLGRGGYGEVYRATTVSSGGLRSQVALKLVRSEVDVAAEAVSRLRDEARLLARLAHPNIVRVIDLCRVTDDEGTNRLALVTELVEGRDLDHLRQPPDPIGGRAAAEVIARVARALQAAWSGGDEGPALHVVHRDVKPGNIAIGRHGDVKLLDFGIARFEGEEREARTATAMLVGSLPYLAPERFLERDVVPASDVFALGCVLFECATGQRWYESVATRLIPTLASDRDRYEAWRWERLNAARLPEPLRPLLANVLAWRASDRHTAGEVADLLDAADLPGPSLRSWCRQRSWDETPPVRGSLAGKVLFEDTGEIRREAATSAAPQAIAAPRRIRTPVPTIDPGEIGGTARQVTPIVRSAEIVRPHRPKAALNAGTIFAPMIPTRAPQQASREVRRATARRRAPPLLLAAGCALLILLAAGLTAALASGLLGAIAWYG